MPPAEALIAATRNGALALRREAELGTLEPGKLADVVLVRGTPWTDIADAREVAVVIQGGHVVVDKRASRTLN